MGGASTARVRGTFNVPETRSAKDEQKQFGGPNGNRPALTGWAFKVAGVAQVAA
jgi:hypothetical protein